jgi:peptidoglycan/LPS O-acetylase OafA/YrhL
MSNNTLGTVFDAKNNSMNIMRLLTALAVIYGHASAVTGRGPGDIFLQFIGYKFIGGVAVDVFFVLSGFLITASAMNGKGFIYFCASRILRIYPALIFCCLLSVFVLGPLLTVSDKYWKSTETWLYLLGNATAYRTEYFLPGVFSGLHDKAVNGSLWSIQVEVRLYLIIGICFLIGVFSSKKIFNTLFFTIIVLGYFIPDIFLRLFEPENHRHVAMMFMIGAFAWINKNSIPMRPDVLFALLVFAASLHGTNKFGFAYALLLPYLVFYIAVGRWGLWFNRIGDYSYGTYLYGWPCQQLVMMAFPDISNIGNAIISGFFAILLAMLSWHLVEKSTLNLKERLKRSRD